MYTTTEVHFQWTKLAESRWDRHHVEPRRAGEAVTVIDSSGHRVKRTSVPTKWITEGYVVEADGEQTDLFEYL